MTTKNITLASSMLLIVIFLSGCGGGMAQIRKELSGKPHIYVKSYNSDIKLHLSGLAGGEIIEETHIPEEFKLISYAIADSFSKNLGNPNVKTERDEDIPEKDSGAFFDSGKISDWSKTNYRLLITSVVTMTYLVKSSPGGVPPYSYRLKVSSEMSLREIKNGEVVMPHSSEDGSVSLASIEKQLSISTGQIKGLNSLMRQFPPTRILKELEKKTRDGVRRFIEDLKA